MTNPNALPLGTRVAAYRVDGVLGSGGFGITYKAHDFDLDSSVALKEYFPATLARRHSDLTVDPQTEGQDGKHYIWGRDRFLQEARTLAQMQHPNVVGVNRLFNANGTAYMALDFIDGPSLRAWLRALNRSPTQEELDAIFLPLLGALDVVHRKAQMHRDIKPLNIMIARPLTPVLIDFGAARELVAQRSQTIAALLTPGYAPAEQYGVSTREQGPWTDIYSLAATIYEAISGRVPPDGLDRTIEDRCTPAVDIGRGRYRHRFLEGIDWGLRPFPRNRPKSVAEWRPTLAGDATPTIILPVATATEIARSSSWSRMTQWLYKS